MDSLAPHRDYLYAEWRAAQASPLSARKAMLVAALVDAYVDRLFTADPEAEDILQFRTGMGQRSEALRLVMALCGQRDGTSLVTEAVAVPIADYGSLAVEDFMVSLYNDHSIQRLRLVTADGARSDMMAVLDAAMAGLDRL